MPKKKHKKKVGATHRRKKKVGAMSELMDFGMSVAAVAAGGVAAAFGIQALNTAFGTQQLPAWAVPVGVAAAGAVLPLIVKKNPLAMDFGLGMATVGTVFAVNELGFSVPGISGLAMSSNAGPANMVVRKAVGCVQPTRAMGAAVPNYLNKTVGSVQYRSRAHMGALLSN